ncbi:uncharacterized protein LOC123688791 [Harmonia axyridis]|uniref:uncharacterized protein LOC123688791 n=1 Tax=Harmonia axyridis TaxID=115357 RepID=UPI001E277AC2|nr:uncharacterized protein LOC123688791 [Harmonia axyridis]
MNSVTSLLETPFSTRDALQQREIQEAGRPMPILKMANLEIADENTLVHYFNSEIYNKNDWICGCTKKNALYCFPCLLYGGDDYWSTSGCTNLVHLSTSISKHELNPAHMHNMFNHSRNFNKTSTEAIQEKNKQIEKNLQILEAIIDTIKCCGTNSISIFEPPPDISDYDQESFQDIFMLTSPSDSSVMTYLQKDPFQNMESLKTDLLKAASEVIREQIIEEIRGTHFVSLILESGDTFHPKIIILRYLNGCEIVERIWKLINVENLNSFMETLITDLRRLIQEPTELISQSMDQLSLKLQDAQCSVYKSIQSHFLTAHLVYLYSHDIFDVIGSMIPMRRQYQTFFGMVWGIHKFFTDVTMPENVRTTYEKVHRGPIKFTENKIENVYLHKNTILGTMITISRNSHDYPDYVVSLAESYVISLQEDLHTDLLEAFYKMMPHFKKIISDYKNSESPTSHANISLINSILNGDIPKHQQQEFIGGNENSQEVQVKIENDMEIQIIDLDSVKEEIPETLATARISGITLETVPTTSKRKRGEELPGKKLGKYAKVIYTIIKELEEFLKYRTNVLASNLVDPKKFLQYSFQYPDQSVTTVTSELHYFSAFESMKLRNELEVLYNQPDFHSLTSSCEVLGIINENNLTSTFPETVKLLKIALTFPTITDDTKRCFDTKNKVRRFLNNSEVFTNIDCLVYFDCEKDFINSIDDFNKKVITKFVGLPNRAEDFKLITHE